MLALPVSMIGRPGNATILACGAGRRSTGVPLIVVPALNQVLSMPASTSAAIACACSLVGPGSGTKTVLR